MTNGAQYKLTDINFHTPANLFSGTCLLFLAAASLTANLFSGTCLYFLSAVALIFTLCAEPENAYLSFVVD